MFDLVLLVSLLIGFAGAAGYILACDDLTAAAKPAGDDA